ncbi:MAG TPA: cation:proton antiporter [Candidatus Saccharimonadales bacterium]|nr:cation:proton antiporter [Candidatus Saccharimonadales bacterium]
MLTPAIEPLVHLHALTATFFVGTELSHADPVVPILIASIFITMGAALGGLIMKWLKQPAVLGELLVGLAAGNLGYYFANPTLTVLREGDNLSRIAHLALTGPYGLSDAALKVLPPGPHTELIAQLLGGPQGQTYISVFAFIDVVSRLAILVLLFLVGLEISLVEMRRVGKYATYVALLGIVLPMILGMGVMKLLHPDSELAADLFIGGILTATSVGITARVLRDIGRDTTEEARIILGAAVIDDVLCLIVLAVVSGLAATGTISFASIAITTGKAALFLVASLGIGIWLTPKIVRRLASAGVQNLKLLFGVSFALVLAWLANVAELATIVGAFAAGMILNSFFDKEVGGISLHELLTPIESLLVPLFFVWMGIQVKLETMASKDVIIAGLLLTVVAVIGKVAAGWGCPPRLNRLAVGFGMMPRGEVGLIFAGIGKAIGVVNEGLFSAVVLLVMLTTVLAPIALRITMGGNPNPAKTAADSAPAH